MGFNFSYPSIIFSYLLIFSSSPSLFSYATDTLTPDQSISGEQTLKSAGDIFELGFFSPGNSKYRYVGIWYQSVSPRSVVWVGNREAPLKNSSGNFTIGSDGNLLVLDGGGSIIWSSNSSAASNNSTAQLLDSGNLVLQLGHGTVLWESFNHPTDTFLPGMKLSLDTKTGERRIFTSWKSPDDPSAGNYSLSLDPLGSAQVFMWEGTVPRWRSGQWNGQVFTGTTMRFLYIYGFKFVNDLNQGIMYFTFTQFNSSLLRFVLQWDGVENSTILVGETQEWETVWAEPTNECEIYGKCGIYGVCNNGDTPICSCLKGFEPRSSEEWSKGNWSGGCVRRTLLDCQLNRSGDGFFRVAGVKVPDRSQWASTVLTEAACETACLNNCSCKAYSFVSGIGCMTWVHDLIDIYQYPEGDNDLYVKLPGSELGTDSKRWKIIVTVSTLGGFFLITCIFLGWKYNKRIKDWLKMGRKKHDLLHNMLSKREARPDFSGPSEYGEEVQEGKGAELPLHTFECISIATDNFSESNKLGEGGFGHVYKGMLPGGQEIAVKRLSRSSGQGLEEFKNEVILIAKLQHRNLVRLLGYCIQGEEKILIYEYMPNGSLDAFLFRPVKQALLDWITRFKIIEGIARGLLYLHRDSRLRIVHRDLKASNILLDEDMNPKISDFGMARIFGGDQNQANTNRVVGTLGYMSPEYAMEGLFSVKSDVYSFGILVLEIVTGRRNNSFHHTENSQNIVGYAWQLWNEDKAVELIDPSIRSSCSIRQVIRCIHIGLLCVQDRANDRPDIPTIILMMASQAITLPMPKQPTYTFEGSPHESDSMANKYESFSTSDVTITMLHGR